MNKRAYLVAAPTLTPGMLFESAVTNFIKALDFNPQQNGEGHLPRHAGFITRGSLEDYRTTFKALAKHFAGKRLNQIRHTDIREYQELRTSGAYTNPELKNSNMTGPGPNSNTINKETGCLIRLLKTAKAWTNAMVETYVPLAPREIEVQRSLLPQEQEHFLRVAASKERWAMIYWYSVLALATTMSTNEIRNLKRKHIDLERAVVTVSPEGAKNRYRMRTIPLSSDALKAASFLLDWARSKGSTQPDHFIFPFRLKRNLFDATRCSECMIRKPFEEVRTAAEILWLRPYDLRHTAITRLAEAGVSIQVIMDMAGHVSQKMQQHYTHISGQAKRQAVDLAALIQADAVKSPSKRKGKAAIFSALAGGEARPPLIQGNGGQDNSVSVASLIKRMQRVGLPPETILAVLSAEGEGVPHV